MSDSRVLRDEVIGEENILRNDNLHGLCSPPHIIRVTKSSRMRLEGYLASKWKYNIKTGLQKVGWAHGVD